MMSVGATSPRRCRRRASGCFARLRSKYGWCCRSNNRQKNKTKTDRIDLVPANSLGQLFSWMLPSRRTNLPAAARARETTLHSIAEDFPTTATSTSPSATDIAIDAAADAAGRLSAGARAGGFTACCEHASAAEEKDMHVEGELKIVDVQQFEAKAGEIADDDSIEDEEAVMVPLIDEDEEVEAASFMPSAFRSNGDSAFRKWKAGDIVMRAVDAQIGGGTFASVVLGQTTSGRTPVAIKILSRESDDFGCQDKYIDREIQTLSLTAHHPNIIAIHGVLSTTGSTFMIMPLVKTDLARLIQDGPLSQEEASAIAAQFLSALEHVHDKRIVHRDLKPANLLLTDGNQVRLADFGFAKVLEEGEDTMTGLCGTKPYLSPEQVNGLAYGRSSDLWAAGVVIYELLHGRTAFCPDSSVDLEGVSTDFGTPEEGDIEMRLDPYDELERENIRAGVFEMDSSRVGVSGADFLRKLITLDPTCRMSARTAGEHAWLGGKEVAALRTAETKAITKERHESQEVESKERALFLRSRRRKRVLKPVKTSSPAPVAEGGQASTACSTSGERSLPTTTSLTAAARSDIPRAMMVKESGSLGGGTSERASGGGVARLVV